MSRIMKKPAFEYAKPKRQIRCVLTAQLISAFVIATCIVRSLYCLNPKCSSYLQRLYSPVSTDLVGNPDNRFSHDEAQM